MVRVHVWLPDADHVGHAALTVANRYISFWPDGAAGKKDLKIKTSQPGLFMESLKEDIRNEGNRFPVTVEIQGLDENSILSYVASLEGDMPRYQLAKNNCSHIVARALSEGAKCKPSFTPHAGQYGKLGRVLGIGIWTPDQVLKFAMELKSR